MKKDKKRLFFIRLTFLFLSLIISIFTLELVVSRLFPQKTYKSSFKDAITCYQRSEYSVFELKPNCIIPFKNFDTNENIQAHINNYGYRGKDIDLKKENKIVLMEGDSFILGFGVKDDEVVSSRLQQKLKNLNPSHGLYSSEVINAGYAGGFGPDGYYLHLKNKGLALQPDLVIFSIFVFNDLTDLADNEWIGVGENGQPEKLISNTVAVDEKGVLLPTSFPLVYRLPFLRNSHLAIFASKSLKQIGQVLKYGYDKVRFAVYAPEFPTGEAKDSNLPGIYISQCLFGSLCHRNTRRLYDDLHVLIKTSKERVDSLHKDKKPHFVVLLIPVEFQIYPETLKKYKDSGIPKDTHENPNPNPQKKIKQRLEKDNIEYIDLLPIMRADSRRLYFKNDGHWNSLDHEVVAEEIFEWISEKYRE